MRAHKFTTAGMVLAILAATAAQPLWADEGTDARRYAAREAMTPDLEEYRGGGCWSPGPVCKFLLIVTSPITLPIAGVVLLGYGIVDCLTPDEEPPAPTKPVPAPKAPEKKKKECPPEDRPIV